MISLLNGFFVPVHISNDDYDSGLVPAVEQMERRLIMKESFAAKLRAGTVNVYIVAPDGRVIDTYLSELVADPRAQVSAMTKMLDDAVKKLKIKEGKPLVKCTTLADVCQAQAEAGAKSVRKQ